MHYLIALSTFLIVSCAHNQLEKRSVASAQDESKWKESKRWHDLTGAEGLNTDNFKHYFASGYGWDVHKESFIKCNSTVSMRMDSMELLWTIDDDNIAHVKRAIKDFKESNLLEENITHLRCLSKNYKNNPVMSECGLSAEYLDASLVPDSVEAMTLSEANSLRKQIIEKGYNLRGQLLCVYADEVGKAHNTRTYSKE